MTHESAGDGLGSPVNGGTFGQSLGDGYGTITVEVTGIGKVVMLLNPQLSKIAEDKTHTVGRDLTEIEQRPPHAGDAPDLNNHR